MIIVIGPVMGALSTSSLTDVAVRRLTVSAECFHAWRTQGDQIDEFPWLAHTRYCPLIEATYCADRPNLPLAKNISIARGSSAGDVEVIG